MAKTLYVATPVQKAVFESVLLGEISNGFWKNARPANHAEAWNGVTVEISTNLGASGFEVPRNYNFVNPDFFKKVETRLMQVAMEVDPNITVKQLKKQLISLNQILGSRLKEVNGAVTKLQRRRKQTSAVQQQTTSKAKATVKKVVANVVEQDEVATI